MSHLPEPDDVDFVVGTVESTLEEIENTRRTIEEFKRRPTHQIDLEEARRILAALGIKSPDYGIQDAQSLLDHWKQCVADLGEAQGQPVEPSFRVISEFPAEKQS